MATTLANTLHSSVSAFSARLLAGAVLGLAVTAGLFWIMQYLIETADHDFVEQPMQATLEFVRVEPHEPIVDDHPKPPKPPPPAEPPKHPDLQDLGDQTPGIAVPDLGGAKIPIGDDFRPGPDIGAYGEGDYLPIVKVTPIYPRRALSQGVEGYCVVQYTVTEHGAVRDPFVLESACTSPLFQQASLEAVLKFKYKPRVIDGVAVEVPGLQNKFTFRITD